MSFRNTLSATFETVSDERHLLLDERHEFGREGKLGGILDPQLRGDVAAMCHIEFRDELSRVLHGLSAPLALDLLLQEGVLGWSLLATLLRLGRHGAAVSSPGLRVLLVSLVEN